MTEPHDIEQSPASHPANPYAHGNNPFANQQSEPARDDTSSDAASHHDTPVQTQQTDQQSPQPPADDAVSPDSPTTPPQTSPKPLMPQAIGQLTSGAPSGEIIPGYSKAIWFSAGFLLGLIGVFVVYFVNIWRPRPIRREVLRYSAGGMLAGAIIDMIILGATGVGTGTGLIGSITGTSVGTLGSTPSTSGSGIF